MVTGLRRLVTIEDSEISQWHDLCVADGHVHMHRPHAHFASVTSLAIHCASNSKNGKQLQEDATAVNYLSRHSELPK